MTEMVAKMRAYEEKISSSLKAFGILLAFLLFVVVLAGTIITTKFYEFSLVRRKQLVATEELDYPSLNGTKKENLL
jgi:hypothetical protein